MENKIYYFLVGSLLIVGMVTSVYRPVLQVPIWYFAIGFLFNTFLEIYTDKAKELRNNVRNKLTFQGMECN